MVGQYVFGTTLAYVNHVAQEEQAKSLPETGGDSGLDPEDFPHLARALQEAEYLGWDVMFDRGLRALVRGLVVAKVAAG